MDNVILITKECSPIGYTTSQKVAYLYIMDYIKDNSKRFDEDVAELNESYQFYCEGEQDYFGIDFYELYAERIDQI